MQKILPLMAVGILLISGLGAVVSSDSEETIHEQEFISFARPLINEQNMYVTIDLDGANLNALTVGKPDLPVVTKVFTFPLGTEIKNIDILFSEGKEQYVVKPISPVPEYQIKSITYSSNEAIKTNEPVSYSDIDIYPESRYTYRTGAGLHNGERVIFLTLYLHPVQYVPSSDMIYYSESASVDVSIIAPEKPVNFPDEYDLLVITPDEFFDAFYAADAEFDVSFVDYKNSKDIMTKIVTLNEIYNSNYFPVQGIDDQEKIKYFIKNAIENWGITNLILVGAGVEGEEIFPVRQAWIGSEPYESYFPSDLYYADIYDADMNFSNWDNDSDGKYAEYRSSRTNDMESVDLYPDVYLGKLPCNNINEVEDVIHKILYYEIHNKMTNKIVQIGGDTFPGDNQHVNEGEYANDVVMNLLPGYSSTQLWASNGGLKKRNIANGFKDGVDFVDFSGHGSWAAWSTHATDDDETWLPPDTLISPYTGFLYIDFDMYQINNNIKFPVVVYNACSCHKYSEHESCMGWTTVKRPNGGGIASFGASGIGYGGQGYGEVQRVFGWMAVKLFDELHNTKILGNVWANAINGYANNFELDDGDYKTIIEMSMFGDPTINIDDGDDPKTKNLDENRPILFHLLNRVYHQSLFFEKLSMIFDKIY